MRLEPRSLSQRWKRCAMQNQVCRVFLRARKVKCRHGTPFERASGLVEPRGMLRLRMSVLRTSDDHASLRMTRRPSRTAAVYALCSWLDFAGKSARAALGLPHCLPPP
jgi:hypothetical protein